MVSTCVLVFAAALTCRGATDTWVGNAPPIFNPNTLWTAPGNWASGTVPPNGADLRFGTGFSSGTNVVVFGNRTIGTLTIDTTTPFSFTDAGGDSLTLTQSLTRTATSDGTQTVGVPVSLASSTSAQSWTLGGAGGLKMTAFLGGFGQQLSLLGGGSVSFSGGATIGTLHVDNATATIDGGSYEFQGAQTAVSIGVAGVASSLTVQGAAVVNAAGRNGYTQIAGTDTVASKLTVQGSRTTWFNGFEMDVGSAGQGQVNVQSGASVGGASGGPFLMVVGAGPGGEREAHGVVRRGRARQRGDPRRRRHVRRDGDHHGRGLDVAELAGTPHRRVG